MKAAIEAATRLEPMRLGDESTGPINEILAGLAFEGRPLDNALKGRPPSSETLEMIANRRFTDTKTITRLQYAGLNIFCD